MSRTICTQYTERPIQHPTTGGGDWQDAVTTLVLALQEQYEMSQGDSDKASDIEDTCFYDGQVDILTWVLGMITVEPVEAKRERLQTNLDAVRRTLDVTDRDSDQFESLHKRADEIAQELNDLGPAEEKA